MANRYRGIHTSRPGPRSGHPGSLDGIRYWRGLLSLATALLLNLALSSTAAAVGPGTLTGVVTGSGGPVAGASVVAKPSGGFGAHTTTAADGSYSLELWPGTYEVGVEPPAGSTDGFTVRPGVAITDGVTTTENITLNQEHGPGRISGTASYSDHSPDAGVQVAVYEEHYVSGPVKGTTVYTDEGGNWDAGELPAGIYSISYVVNVSNGSPGSRTNWTVGGGTVFIQSGQTQVLVETLSGPKPEGMVEAAVTAAEGWPSRGNASLLFPGEAPELGFADEGKVRLWAPTGSYTIEASGNYQEDDASKQVLVTVTNGRVTKVTVPLDPNPIPAGISRQHSEQELAWLNHQRSRWGLPTGLSQVPVWSDACAAHDNYGHRNNRLEHEEASFLPGASPGGNWAGTHAVLAEGGGWAEEDNPWYDAPYHLGQLFAPSMSVIGLDDSQGFECATTWPGIVFGLDEKKFAPGTVFTFPGNGTTGLPPAEFASELPSTPNKDLGIPDLAGRQLIVYETGTEYGSYPQIEILNASLTSDTGSVPVKWVDEYPGGIIVPVEPLKPFTTYHASVTLAALTTNFGEPVSQITHEWTFTTGHENPNGYWGEPKPKPAKPAKPRRIVVVRWRKRMIIVKGWHFKRGHVVIKRKILLRRKRRLNGKVMARAHVGAKGKFVARFRWPEKRHIALRVYQNGKSTAGIYTPPHPPGWYRRHHHRHRHRH